MGDFVFGEYLPQEVLIRPALRCQQSAHPLRGAGFFVWQSGRVSRPKCGRLDVFLGGRMANPQEQILALAAACTHDPLRWVNTAYDWGIGELAGVGGPRDWQADVLAIIRDHLAAPATRHQPLRLAVASGHGIGKSAAIGMIINWALSTCEDCKVVVTANTDTQLRTKTSPEIAKWLHLSLTSPWFDAQATAVASVEREHARSWRADLVPWSDSNTEAFAGLHNQGRRIVLIFDEASAIADKVWEVAEGALTDAETEILWIAFGNPTRNTGRFRECFRRYKHRWHTRQIDSRNVAGTNLAQIEKWAEDYGEDSDFFKVRVRGLFPAMAARQFISEADVAAAYGRGLLPAQFDFAPKILSVDPAWEGDDEFVIGLRQGLAFRILHRMAKNDNDLVAAQIIARFEDEEGADAVFIDAGFGTGIVSAGQGLGRHWTLVWFAGVATEAGNLNKRAEMWKAARDWLKAGGCLPADPTLRDELMAPEIVPRVDGKLQIEAKHDMKARGIPSPNRADALVLTFAYPVTRREAHRPQREPAQARRGYDPFGRVMGQKR